MIIEISVAVAAGAFLVLAVFGVLALIQTRKTLKKLEKVSEHSAHLTAHLNELTLDIKKKTEALDPLFRPFYGLKKERSEEDVPDSKIDRIAELVACLAKTVVIIHKFKGGSK